MATVAEKIIEVKAKVEKANNIKELKATIADLTQQMEDYQEKMREGEDVTADYEKTIEGLVDAQEKLTNVMKAGTSQISAQEGSYNALVNRMAALKKVQKSVTDDSSRVKLAEDINTINDQLKAYDQANGVYVRNVGNYKSALEDLDVAVLDFGGSMRQAMETIEPTKAKFESIQKISSGVASGFAAVQGMAALLGAENEELQKTFVKVQSAMAIAQGIGGLKDLIEGITQWGVAFGKTVQEAQNMAKASTALTAATEATTAATEATAAASTADATAKNAEAVAVQNTTKASTALTAASEASAAASEATAAASTADATAKNAEAVAAQNMAKASTVLTASSKASAVASKESATASAADATAKSAAAVATQNMAKASTVLTASSKASAAASAADATAKGAAAVATEGATVAQTGLNTAMMANPIGLVVASVAGLVAVFVLLKDDIVELLGGTEKLNAAWQKFTPILSGVGNVIKQVVLGPIKTFITSLKTIVSTVSNLAKGDFMAAFEAIKDGALQVVDDIKDTYNVIGNFQEGYADKSTEIEEKRIRKAAELRDKELEQFIKDNEAKSGSDWKYSEEGKKAYEEYYKNKEKLYDKDSEEYKQNQRDIWMYNREYQDRITKKEEDESKKRQESLKKSLEDEKKAREKALQDYNTMVEEYLKSDSDKMEDTWEKRREALENALKKGLIIYEEYKDKKKELENALKKGLITYEEYENKNKELENFLKKELATYEKYKNKKEKLDNSFKKGLITYEEYENKNKELENFLKKELVTYEKYENKKKELEKKISIEKNTFDFNKQLSDFDVETKLSELKAKSKEFNFKFRVEIEGEDIDKIEHINSLYNEQMEIYEKEDGILAKLAARVVEFANEHGANSELAINATKELHSATLEYLNLGIDKFKAISDVRIETLEREIAAEEAAMEKRTFMLEKQYLEYESSQKYFFDFGNNYLTQMYKRWAAEDEINKARIESLETMKQKYIEASQNMQLTEYERVKAKEEAARLEQQIEVESANHTIAVNKRKSEAADNYVSTIQDSLNGIGDILSNVANAWETSIQAQIDAGEISEEEGEKQMENMRGIQSAIAMINALSSAVGAYNSMASIPFVGPALGAAAAAAALASGIAQVVAINKVKKGDKGGEDDSRYAEAIPTMPDYNPQAVTNVTGEQETQNLANAVSNAPIWVSVKDIDSAQSKVKVRENESTF